MSSERPSPPPSEAPAGQAGRHGRALTGLARGSSLNLVGALVNQASLFGILVLLSRVLGETAVGVYGQAFAIRALLQLVCLVGMRSALTRFVAVYRVRDDPGTVRGAVAEGMVAALALSLVAAAVLWLAAPTLATSFFDDQALVTPIRIVAYSLPFNVVMTAALAATQGFQTMKAHAGISLILEPVLRLVLTVGVLAAGFGVEAALWALLAGSVVAGLASVVALRRLLGRLPAAPMRFPTRELAGFAGASWLASVASQGLLWADVVILGAFLSSDEVGVYQVASRVVLLASIAIPPLTTSLGARIADAWGREDHDDLQAAYRGLGRWTWLISLPAYALLVAYGDHLLRLFGGGFGDGRVVMAILMIGTIVDTQGAPASVVLNMAGRNALNMVNNLAALVVNIALNIMLVPRLGIEGAAIAWSVSLGVYGLLRIDQVRRLLTRSMPWSWGHTRAVLAAVVAGAAGFAVRFVPGLPYLVELVVGSLVIAVVFLVTVWRLGLDPDDRAVVQQIGRGLGSVRLRVDRQVAATRLRLRTRGYETPEVPISIDELISPLRYDIVVRQQLFAALLADPAARRDPDAAVALARTTAYLPWFLTTATRAIGLTTDDPAALDAAFALRVRRSMNLLDQFEAAGGFDSRFPVTVRLLAAGTPTSTGKTFAADRYLPVDGCHRLALLRLSGCHYLRPSEYRIIEPDVPPLDNTPQLVRAIGLSKADYLRFVCLGFGVAPTADVRQLRTEVRHQGDARLADLDRLLTHDAPWFDPPAPAAPAPRAPTMTPEVGRGVGQPTQSAGPPVGHAYPGAT